MRILRFCLLVLVIFQTVYSAELIFPDFDDSMCRGGLTNRKQYLRVGKQEPLLSRIALARELYNNFVAHFEISEEVRIPKIVHQVWLGSPVPEKFKSLMATWQGMEGWEYILWTDESIKSLTMINQKLFDEGKDYGEKVDILRYELINQFGGLYVDVDFENLDTERFNTLHASADFYVGFAPTENMGKCYGTAIIGATPGHPVIQYWIETLEENFYKDRNQSAVITTGPVFLTNATNAYYKKYPSSPKEVVFPCSFFFPFTHNEIRNYVRKKLTPMPESVAVHYWAGSW